MCRARVGGVLPPHATSPDAADPRLRTRTYGGDFDRVWSAASRAARRLAKVRVVDEEPARGRLVVETQGLLGVRDRVELHLTELETGEVQVEGVAESQMPLADFGHGRRALRHVLHLMDEALDGKE